MHDSQDFYKKEDLNQHPKESENKKSYFATKQETKIHGITENIIYILSNIYDD